MENIIDRTDKGHTPAESRGGPSLARLRKRIFVLPSGRILKVVLDDDESAPGPVPAC
jgi:hypothetical protein